VQRVFISYRREDAADVAGRIRDWLVQTWNLARENVFMDVSTILPGADFEQVIDQAIAQCDAMIIVMSPSWLTHVYTSDTSYPRFEAEAALRRNLLIIPVLVGGATTPTAEQLPETLRPLLRRNIRLIRPDSFDYDMEWVRKALGVRTISRAPFITAISALLLVAASLGTLSQVPEGNPVWRIVHSATAPPNASPTSPRPIITTSSPVPGTTIPRPQVTLESPADKFKRLYRQYTTSVTATIAYPLLQDQGKDHNWEQTAYSNKRCSFTPGPYHLESYQFGGKSFFCYGDPGASFGDFVYTVQTFVKKGDGSIMIFRAGSQFQDFFRFEVHTDGTYSYFRGQGSGNGRSASIRTGLNVSNRLGAVALGTSVGLFCNDELLTIVSDTVSSSGRIGVGADAYTQNAYVEFTYAQIWELKNV
jgi:hypothetical protein